VVASGARVYGLARTVRLGPALWLVESSPKPCTWRAVWANPAVSLLRLSPTSRSRRPSAASPPSASLSEFSESQPSPTRSPGPRSPGAPGAADGRGNAREQRFSPSFRENGPTRMRTDLGEAVASAEVLKAFKAGRFDDAVVPCAVGHNVILRGRFLYHHVGILYNYMR
jgi:hypothetical protein